MLQRVVEGSLFSKSGSLVKGSKITDFLGRLNHGHTVLFLLVCAIVVTAKQYIFEPIQCWIPVEFSSAWEQYVENYCWVQNTYYLPVHAAIPNDLSRRKEQEINYYQWIPFILCLQALLFYAPFCLWVILSSLSGLNIDIVVKMASECLTSDVRLREQNRRALAHYLSSALHLLKPTESNYSSSNYTSCSRRALNPAYLTSAYLVTKVLYIVNSVCQFFIVNALLGTRNTLYGLEMVQNMIKGLDWEESALFPRVTLCDFQERGHAQTRLHTVQCVLPTNMLNEKIFLLIWFWLFLIRDHPEIT